MEKMVVVEMADGEQEFFEDSYDAFKFARGQENQQIHSVDHIAIGEFEGDKYVVIYGQELRKLLRSLDNINEWIKAGIDGG